MLLRHFTRTSLGCCSNALSSANKPLSKSRAHYSMKWVDKGNRRKWEKNPTDFGWQKIRTFQFAWIGYHFCSWNERTSSSKSWFSCRFTGKFWFSCRLQKYRSFCCFSVLATRDKWKVIATQFLISKRKLKNGFWNMMQISGLKWTLRLWHANMKKWNDTATHILSLSFSRSLPLTRYYIVSDAMHHGLGGKHRKHKLIPCSWSFSIEKAKSKKT